MVETNGTSKPGEILEIEVACSECGECAAKIALVPPGKKHRKAGSTAREDVGVYDGIGRGDGGSYIVESITGKCVHTIPAEYVEPIRQALEQKDWARLHKADPELVPSWCRMCEAHYCRKHTVTLPFFDEGFYDYTMGWCPKNHPRMVDD